MLGTKKVVARESVKLIARVRWGLESGEEEDELVDDGRVEVRSECAKEV
jgi:hypothetical protein